MPKPTAPTNPHTNDLTPTPFYKRASFPWAIIVLTATLAAGFVLGWHTQHSMSQAIDAKAASISARLK